MKIVLISLFLITEACQEKNKFRFTFLNLRFILILGGLIKKKVKKTFSLHFSLNKNVFNTFVYPALINLPVQWEKTRTWRP